MALIVASEFWLGHRAHAHGVCIGHIGRRVIAQAIPSMQYYQTASPEGAR